MGGGGKRCDRLHRPSLFPVRSLSNYRGSPTAGPSVGATVRYPGAEDVLQLVVALGETCHCLLQFVHTRSDGCDCPGESERER